MKPCMNETRRRDLISNPFHEEADGYVLAKGCGGISGEGGNLIILNPFSEYIFSE